MLGDTLDISIGDDGEDEEGASGQDLPSDDGAIRKYIGVRFQCCGTYARAYPNKAMTAYQANCPKCSKPVRFRIGPGGTASRFFDVY